ncbi:hypothetical protein D3C74_404620 [compost metagenome]
MCSSEADYRTEGGVSCTCALKSPKVASTARFSCTQYTYCAEKVQIYVQQVRLSVLMHLITLSGL